VARIEFCLQTLVVLCMAGAANAAALKPVDRGPIEGLERRTPISVTVALSLPRLSEAEQLQQAIYTPGSPQYHRFLTSEQFAARFAPGDAAIAKIESAFARYGLKTERITATTLRVTGMPADIEQAFSVSLHRYEVPSHGRQPGYTFRGPANRPVIPAGVSSSVSAVMGLSDRPMFHPHVRTLPGSIHAGPGSTASAKTGHAFGSLTVTDFADLYDVQPLYQAGITGSGRTLGIVTLAAFTPSDAYAYWDAIGLSVAPNRISIVNLDGGPPAPSDASGSIETTLDVEQAGGIAPGAKMIVYQAPDTDQGFVDAFAAVVEANQADSISTSWGEWEWLESVSPVNDPSQNELAAFAQAFHELLLRASLQGQTVFAASGDGGAYDVNRDFDCWGPYAASVKNSCSLTLSVDYPASDPLITAAGGTTLAGHQVYCLNSPCTAPYYQIQIPQESVWGWDYLNGLCAKLGYDPVSCGTFGGGSGGGVSILFAIPSYQAGISGTQLSQPGQAFYLQPYGLLYNLPANFAGRNVPDISFNADPDTGYVILYTSDVSGLGASYFGGGTSFVAPQLNGVAALLAQYAGGRIGFLNPALYSLAALRKAWAGTNAPLREVPFGDNWFYEGGHGYNLGSGLGTLDVYHFAQYLRGQLQ